MINKNLIIKGILLFAFLIVTNISFAQKVTGEDMAKAVFKTMQNSDVETFLSYCISKERKAKMISNLSGSSGMEKGIKQELENEDLKLQIKEIENNYQQFLDGLIKENIDPKKGVFKEIENIDHQFEITNLKCFDITFKVLFGKNTYRFEINLFETKGDIFLFGIHKLN